MICSSLCACLSWRFPSPGFGENSHSRWSSFRGLVKPYHELPPPDRTTLKTSAGLVMSSETSSVLWPMPRSWLMAGGVNETLVRLIKAIAIHDCGYRVNPEPPLLGHECKRLLERLHPGRSRRRPDQFTYVLGKAVAAFGHCLGISVFAVVPQCQYPTMFAPDAK